MSAAGQHKGGDCMKKVIVACGGGVATSTVLCEKIKEIARDNGVDVTLAQCTVNEIESHLDGADLIVTSVKVSRDYGIPMILALSYIIGMGQEETTEELLSVLKG